MSRLITLMLCPVPAMAHAGHALVHDLIAHGGWVLPLLGALFLGSLCRRASR